MVGSLQAVTESFTVAQLCQIVGESIDERFPDEVWLSGAISGLSRSSGGHVYFDLAEPGSDPGSTQKSVVSVVLFSSARQRVNTILRRARSVQMGDGVEIRIRGRVGFYSPQGRIQMVMSLIDPTYTAGRMAQARDALLETLRSEGLIGANQALSWPVLPIKVALITSTGSAAHADFVHELTTSGYRFTVTLFDARVQGSDSVPELVAAITEAGDSYHDVVVVVRGGGSRGDLAAFDHEQVARAIAATPIPVVVGVGHETDRSVADEVAHLSAKTPTAAGAALVDTVRRFDQYVATTARRLAGFAVQRLDTSDRLLTQRASRLTGAATSRMTIAHHQLTTAATHLDNRSRRIVELNGSRLDQARAELGGHDPARLLGRGWTMTHTPEGQLVNTTGAVAEGDTIVTTTVDGTITSTVTGTISQPQPRETESKS